jgi:hypothetical protein
MRSALEEQFFTSQVSARATDVRDGSLAARSSGGGAGVKEDRKPRPEVSLMPAPPPYNRPYFHRVVRAARVRRNFTGFEWPVRGVSVDLPCTRTDRD